MWNQPTMCMTPRTSFKSYMSIFNVAKIRLQCHTKPYCTLISAWLWILKNRNFFFRQLILVLLPCNVAKGLFRTVISPSNIISRTAIANVFHRKKLDCDKPITGKISQAGYGPYHWPELASPAIKFYLGSRDSLACCCNTSHRLQNKRHCPYKPRFCLNHEPRYSQVLTVDYVKRIHKNLAYDTTLYYSEVFPLFLIVLTRYIIRYCKIFL